MSQATSYTMHKDEPNTWSI